MTFPRTPLAPVLLAAAFLAPLSAFAPPAARAEAPGYDARRSPDVDVNLVKFLVKRYGYRYAALDGALTAPDGHRLTREELSGPFYDDGPGRLTDREHAILFSLGARPAVREGRPVILEPDCEAPFSPFRMTLIRRGISDGQLDEASAAVVAAALDPEVAESYVRAFGYRREGAGFLDRDGKVVTYGDRMKLETRVAADREPDVAALARLSGFIDRRRGGAAFLWSPESGWLDRGGGELLLKSVGLLGQRDPKAPFIPGPDLPENIKAALRRSPGYARRGEIVWDGRTLTVAEYRRLLEPIDPGRLEGSDALWVQVALSQGYTVSADRKTIVGPDGQSPLYRLYAGNFAAERGLAGQRGLGEPFNARAPGATGVNIALQRTGWAVDPTDGTLRRDGRVALTSDVIEMLGIFDLSAKRRQDPRLADAIETFMKREGFSPRVVGGRTFLCGYGGGACLTNESMRGDMADYAGSDRLLRKAGLIAEQLKRARAGQPLDPFILARIDRIIEDSDAYLSPAYDRARAQKPAAAKELLQALDASAEDSARIWASVRQSHPAEPRKLPHPDEESARRSARAARDGSEELSLALERAFDDVFRTQGSAVAAEQRAEFVDPRTGKSHMPFLALMEASDTKDAHFDPGINRIVFVIQPELARSLAAAARPTAPGSIRTPEELARLAAEFASPAKLKAAILSDPGLAAVFAREQAWNYIHEHGHALSYLKGPASLGHKGLQAATLWTEDEKVAYLWETRYTHELLMKSPRAEIPPAELRRYLRTVNGYDMWSVDVVQDHLAVLPGRYVTLREARTIQAGWIAKARHYVAAGSFPGAAAFLERLEEGAAGMKESADAYAKFFDRHMRARFAKMSIEAGFIMIRRHEAPGPEQNKGLALSFRAMAPVRIAAALAGGRLTLEEAAELKGRASSAAELLRDGKDFARTWRPGPDSSRRPWEAARSAALTLETVGAYFRHLERNPRELADSGLTLKDATDAQAYFKTRSEAAWKEKQELDAKETKEFEARRKLELETKEIPPK